MPVQIPTLYSDNKLVVWKKIGGQILYQIPEPPANGVQYKNQFNFGTYREAREYCGVPSLPCLV